MSRRNISSVLIFIVILFNCTDALAYVDPGIGSVIYQILFLVFSASIVVAGVFYKRIKRPFSFIGRNIKRIFIKDKVPREDKK